jgi:ATP-dependent exoDNAse (exonuclease V) beta subunit
VPEAEDAVSDAELVSAGAGTGKTSDIVDRIAEAVAGGVAIERVAAITFTNRAAAELQDRLKLEFARRGLGDAARRIDAAYVSTIHAFCLRLATENPVESGVPPETRPLDERGSRRLLGRAIAEALAAPAVLADVRFLFRTCLRYERESATEQLKNKILDLLEKTRAVAKTEGDLLRMAEENDAEIAARLPAPLDDAGLRRIIDPPLKTYLDWWRRHRDEAKSRTEVRESHDSIAPIAGGPVRIDALWDFHAQTVDAWKWEEYNGIIGALKDAVARAIVLHPDWHEWYRQYARALFRIAAAALGTYDALKRLSGAMDFADMQAAALRLLRSDAGGRPFAEILRGRFDFIVVDEFQDTSPLQFAVVEALRGGVVRARYVGDLKQAIYGFRDADARLFASLLAAGRPETLAGSRRSRPELLAFFNDFFRPLMKQVGLAYDDLVQDAVSPYDRAPRAPEIAVVPFAESDDVGPAAEGIARWARALLDAGTPVFDRERRDWRAMRPGDVAVLTRTNREAEAAADALKKRGLRSTLPARGIAERHEVQLFRALVAAFANPANRVSVAAALHSEVYGLSHASLHALARAGWFGRTPAPAGGVPELPEAHAAAVERFAADHADLAPRLRREAFAEAVDAVFERARLRDRFAGKPGGPQCLANLEQCREVAARYAKASMSELANLGISGQDAEGFLVWFDLALEGEAPEASVRPADEDAVQVMTIHKAKGLEFAAVAVIALNDWMGPRLDRIEIVRPAGARPDDLAAARVRCFPRWYRGVPEGRFLDDAVGEADAETARLLYVAMTRARERLAIAWPLDGGERRGVDLLAQAGIRFDGEKSRLRIGAKECAVEVLEPGTGGGAAQPGAGRHGEVLAGRFAPEFELAPAPSREAAAPRLSPTAIGRWLDCPLTWWLVDVCGVEHRGIALSAAAMPARVEPLEGVAGPAPRVEGRVDLGTLLHRALAAGLPMDETLARVERLGGPAARAYAARALPALKAHLEGMRPTGPLLREHPFLFRAGETVVSGVIDAGVPAAAGLWIVDLKTNDIAAADVPRWAEHYAPQLWTYALGVAKTMPGAAVAGLKLVFTTPGVVATLPAAPAGFEARVAAAARRIARGAPFEKEPARDCGACPYREGCPGRR